MREQPSVAGMPSRHDAVEHIHAQRHALDQIGRRSDSHEIPGFVLRQVRLDLIDDFIHEGLWLADRQTADRVSREIRRDQPLGALPSQILVSATLHDS